MAKADTELTFEGFPPEAFSWFEGIEADNSKTFFTAHRDTYERAVRGALEAMLEELADELGGRVRMFRQHRDIRFSADKSPYKTSAHGVIIDRPDSHAALSVRLSSKGLHAGSGYHELDAERLTRFRDAVVDEEAGPPLVQAIADAEAAGFGISGEALKSAPRGYPREHARLRLLRHKSLFAGRSLDAVADGIEAQAALGFVRATWSACAAMNAWLDEHVGPGGMDR